MLLDVGLENVWKRIDALTTHLCEGLENKGCRVFTPRKQSPLNAAASSYSIRLHADRGGKPPAWVAADLKKKNIEIAVRGGRLRASPHFYNTVDQIDRLIDALPGG